MQPFRTSRRIEFADTDMAGIVHFSRFFVFMETAEHEYLRTLGINVHFHYDGGLVGWPRASATCEFHSPVRVGDVLDIAVVVLRKGNKSLTYGFELSCAGRRVAEGKITTICCVLDGGAGLRSIPIPPFLAEQIHEGTFPSLPVTETV